MDTKNIIIICLVVVVVVMAMAIGVLIGQQGTNHNAANSTNVTHANNTINNTSSHVEKINSDDASGSNSKSSAQGSDWYDSEGAHHFYENGKEYVGSREGQHMDIDTHNYVKEHGMT